MCPFISSFCFAFGNNILLFAIMAGFQRHIWEKLRSLSAIFSVQGNDACDFFVFGHAKKVFKARQEGMLDYVRCVLK